MDANPTVDASLKVGSVSEQVEVRADAALVETRSTGVGTVVDNQRVLEMPLNGRNATELIFLPEWRTSFSGRVMRTLAGEWQISPILKIKSAQFSP